MKEIWKYPLDPISQISMPVQAKILAVQEQCGRPCLWALVNVSNPKETRYFAIRGTGLVFLTIRGTILEHFNLRVELLYFMSLRYLVKERSKQ